MRAAHDGMIPASRRRPTVAAALGLGLVLCLSLTACSDDQPTPKIGADSNTVTAPTTTAAPTTGSESTAPPTTGDLDDPTTQLAAMNDRLDASTDEQGDLDVCALRSVWLDLDALTGPATIEQAKAYVDFKLRLIGLTANAAPDRLSKDADVLRAHALAAGSDAAAHGFDPGYLRSERFDVCDDPAYVRSLKRVRGWMDDECGDPDVTVP